MQQIVDQYVKDGYVVIEGFLSENEANELKKAGEEFTKNLPEESKRAIFDTVESQQSKNKYFLESADKISVFFEAGALDSNGKLLVEPDTALNKVGHALHKLNPVFRKYTFDERVKEMCWQLGFQEPCVVQSMYIYKNPGIGSEVKNHQDATYLYTDPVKIIGFWIALEDVTLENGCLYVASGSHLSGVHQRYIRNPDKDSDELLIYTGSVPIYQTNSFTPVLVTKGSCVLIHGQVVHHSKPNRSMKSRHVYTFHVIEQKDTVYSPDNWLQPTEENPFLNIYKNN